MVQVALAAAELLAADGISAEVVDPRSLVPLDVATLVESVRKTSRAVVVDHGTVVADGPVANVLGDHDLLLRHGLALADRDGLPVYLESSNPANLGLYRRHGFDVLEEVRVGASPPKFALLRAPG